MTSWQVLQRAAYVVSDHERVVVLSLDHPGVEPQALLFTGAAIWQELLDPDDQCARPVVGEDDLLDRLATRYSTSPDAIRPEVTNFLSRLAGAGLVTQRSED